VLGGCKESCERGHGCENGKQTAIERLKREKAIIKAELQNLEVAYSMLKDQV